MDKDTTNTETVAQSNGNTMQNILYLVIIGMLFAILHNGGIHPQHQNTEYEKYASWVEKNEAQVDYAKLRDYMADHENIDANDDNTTVMRKDDTNNVFHNDVAIYDMEYNKSQEEQAKKLAKTDDTWFLTCDTSSYRLNVITKIDGEWKTIAVMACDVGSPSNPTPQGQYTTQTAFEDYGGLMFATQFAEDFYIADLYVGYPAACSEKGNIYLSRDNAKFIADVIPEGTTILIHE